MVKIVERLPSRGLEVQKNVTQWCASVKCDVFIIQWYTWYIYIYVYIYACIYIYIALYEIYHIILSVLSVFVIQLHVSFNEQSRFICKIHDV